MTRADSHPYQPFCRAFLTATASGLAGWSLKAAGLRRDQVATAGGKLNAFNDPLRRGFPDRRLGATLWDAAQATLAEAAPALVISKIGCSPTESSGQPGATGDN